MINLRAAARIARSFNPVALLAVSLAAFAVGCENKHIGRPCDIGLAPATSGTIITSSVAECPSQLCILPAAGDAHGTGALCTAGCSSDDDCADAEGAPAGAAGDPRCKQGFSCAWPTPVGPFCCQRMCICRDFLTAPPEEPAACRDPAGSCANVR
jgi:hypothetical protein